MAKLLVLAGLLVLGGSLGFAGCDSKKASSPGSSTAQNPPNPYTNPMKSRGSSPTRLAGDGRYFGYVRAVDGASKPPTVSFDVAQFFFGKDAQTAAERDGVVPPGEPVPNDHYQRNPDTKAQALTVAPNASVTAAGPVSRLITNQAARSRCRSGCENGVVPVSPPEFFAAFEKKRYGMTAAGDPVWVTIRDGLVVRIDEQYFP
jgi:hypothetical protein